MIRFAFWQLRVHMVVAVLALGVIAAVFAFTGPDLAEIYQDTVENCAATNDCDEARHAMLEHHSSIRMWFGLLVVAVPVLLGVFWGAPLIAREFENETIKVAWSQSITRTRWMLTKLLTGTLCVAAVVALLSWMMTWWARPLDNAAMNQFGVFDQRDIVPVAHAMFAFVLGVTTGLLFRRTIAAMAVTLVICTAMGVLGATQVRGHLLTPRTTQMELGRAISFSPTSDGVGMTVKPAEPEIPDAMVLSATFIDENGNRPSKAELGDKIATSCPNMARARPSSSGDRQAAPDQGEATGCLDAFQDAYDVHVTFHPAGKYWTLQWIESGIYAALALLLAVFSLAWTRWRQV
jgi:hypothetical protein